MLKKKDKSPFCLDWWWDSDGNDMFVPKGQPSNNPWGLTLLNGTHTSKIRIFPSWAVGSTETPYFVECTKCDLGYRDKITTVRVLLYEDDLALIFGITDFSGYDATKKRWGKDKVANQLLERYLGGYVPSGYCSEDNVCSDCIAIPEKCFRALDYLNISCPGTGLEGDPNMSLKLTADIQKAVKSMLSEECHRDFDRAIPFDETYGKKLRVE